MPITARLEERLERLDFRFNHLRLGHAHQRLDRFVRHSILAGPPDPPRRQSPEYHQLGPKVRFDSSFRLWRP